MRIDRWTLKDVICIKTVIIGRNSNETSNNCVSVPVAVKIKILSTRSETSSEKYNTISLRSNINDVNYQSTVKNLNRRKYQ